MRAALPGLMILLLLAVATPAAADPLTPAKKAGIQHLMFLVGGNRIADTLAEQLKQRVTGILAGDSGQVPQQLGAIIDYETGELMTERFQELQEHLVQLYATHFSHEEIKQLIAFYRSDIGKKALHELPAIQQEGRLVGQQWGEKMLNELVRRIDARLSAGHLQPTK